MSIISRNTRSGFREDMRKHRIFAAVAAIFWSAFLAASLCWNLQNHRKTGIEFATIQARTAYRKDLEYRNWNMSAGGVYALVSNGVQPNPYLFHYPQRDIKTTDGKELTKINAAYMNRLVFEQELKSHNVRSHLTSLNPLRPENAPDTWERQALEEFDRGSNGAVEVVEMENEQYLRFMKPLYVESGCLECHAIQGYRLGDIRGGLSISIPLAPVFAVISFQGRAIWLIHGIAWLGGMFFLYLRERDLGRTALALHKSERRAQTAREAAEAANMAKSRFLSKMSHEIRTPLNSIIGMTELTLKDSLSDEQRDNLETIRYSSESLLGIINDVLDLSKIEAEMMTLDNACFALDELVRASVDIFRHQTLQKGVGLIIDIAPDVERNLVGDPLRLKQVLMNLVGNAVKFTEEGVITVSVTKAEGPHEEWHTCLVFRVFDTGIGIPKDRINRIFENFSQADNSITRQFGGTGLGLSISKRLIALMGGKIYVESTPGQGSEFTFILPFAVGTSAQDDTPGTDVTEPRLSRPASILLVEDNPLNQKLAMKLLEKKNHTVTVANNGTEALEKLKTFRFNLVLMDIEMPDMDGYEATKHIRSHHGKDIPIVAMTAHALEGYREKCLAAGMDDYISKPISSRELYSIIDRNALFDHLNGQPSE